MISIEKAILADICLGLPLGKIMFSVPGHLDPAMLPAAPDTFLFRGEQLALMKSLYERGDERIAEAVSELARSADAAIEAAPFSVTQKPRSRFSEDPRDYQSLAKYLWPNPDTQDGLPYVNRDGEVNPECYADDFDYIRLVRFSETVVLLALAAYLTEREIYRRRAALLLETWFVNPETRQNPHFQFAQDVPGRKALRWQGVIEARFLVYVTEAVRLLSGTDALKPASQKQIRNWFSALLKWMRESEHGRKAKEAKNNIGFWYDLQCMVYAQFCGNVELADRIVHEDVVPRLNAQMAADGSLPRELGRAYPKDYVAFTLAAMALISRAGEQSGLELWNQRQGDGRNFQAAHDWLLKAGDARKLLSAVETKPVSAADEFHDLGFLLETGVKLRAFQRIAETETEAAAVLRAENERLKRQLEDLASISEKLMKDREALSRHAGELEKRYRAILSSASWRVTGPMRVIVRRVRSLLTGKPGRRNYVPRFPTLSGVGPGDIAARSAPAAATHSYGLQDTSRSGTRSADPASPATRPARKQQQPGSVRSAGVENRIKALVQRHLPPGAKKIVKGALSAAPGKWAVLEGIAGAVSRAKPAADPLQTLLAARPRDEEALKKEYREKGLDKEPDTFVLYRIVGNDLYPRHKKGQSRENVRFLLENEPEIAGCEKRWVVNRIIDPDEEKRIIAMLEAHSQPFLHIPFVAEEYREIGWDFDCLPEPGFLASEAFQKLGPEQQDRARTALYRLKNNYVMHNNGARNAALRDGRSRAKWVLPWDGNGFVTRKAWEQIRQTVTSRPHLKYFAVPMERVTDNALLLSDDFTPHPVEEPQLIFRRDAGEEFNEAFPYGRRPKVELFWRLGIPGPWDGWKDDPWEQKRRECSSEAHQFGVAGWVARMNSGIPELEQRDKESTRNRRRVRQEAILTAIDHVDSIVHSTQPDPDGFALFRRPEDDATPQRRPA